MYAESSMKVVELVQTFEYMGGMLTLHKEQKVEHEKYWILSYIYSYIHTYLLNGNFSWNFPWFVRHVEHILD